MVGKPPEIPESHRWSTLSKVDRHSLTRVPAATAVDCNDTKSEQVLRFHSWYQSVEGKMRE